MLAAPSPEMIENASRSTLADLALKASTRLWFAVTTVGLWIFGYYIVVLYGGSIARWDLDAWNKILFYGYIPGDLVGNLALGAHVVLAIVITVGGPLQLIPQIRARAPRFHHWNGRAFILAAFITSGGGVYLNFFRGNFGGTPAIAGTTVNAVFIMLFAVLALRYAIVRDIDTHRRWALRLFIVIGGVWYFRIGISLWLFINQGPVGFDPETFRGPFLSFLNFAQFLFPLAILELYFLTTARAGSRGKFAMATGLTLLSGLLGLGIFLATLMFWLPNL